MERMNPPDRITIDPTGEARVRDLPVRALTVYKDLEFLRPSETKVIKKYGLEPEDITAVREYAIYEIRSRTHDDVTGKKLLPKDSFRDGMFYKGRCRNATVARWRQSENKFYHWREKFGHIFIETIKYATDEEQPWWDVFNPVEELPNPPFEIPFDLKAKFRASPPISPSTIKRCGARRSPSMLWIFDLLKGGIQQENVVELESRTKYSES